MRKIILFFALFSAAVVSAQNSHIFDLPTNSKPQGKAADFYTKQEVQRDKDTFFEQHQYTQYLQYAQAAYREGKYADALNYYQDAKSMYLQLRSHVSASNDTSDLDKKIQDCAEKAKQLKQLKTTDPCCQEKKACCQKEKTCCQEEKTCCQKEKTCCQEEKSCCQEKKTCCKEEKCSKKHK